MFRRLWPSSPWHPEASVSGSPRSISSANITNFRPSQRTSTMRRSSRLGPLSMVTTDPAGTWVANRLRPKVSMAMVSSVSRNRFPFSMSRYVRCYHVGVPNGRQLPGQHIVPTQRVSTTSRRWPTMIPLRRVGGGSQHPRKFIRESSTGWPEALWFNKASEDSKQGGKASEGWESWDSLASPVTAADLFASSRFHSDAPLQ